MLFEKFEDKLDCILYKLAAWLEQKPRYKMFKDVTRFCNLRYWVRTWVQVGQKLIKTKNL